MRTQLALALVLATIGSAWPAAAAPYSVFYRDGGAQQITAPPLPPIGQYPVQLVLDDEVAEGGVGVAGVAARQFLWFNRFTTPADFQMAEIWVLFAPEANVSVGAPIELVVYSDNNGDPSDGATLLATYAETIQVLDGVTFSVYTLPSPLDVPSGDVLVGVIPRFVVSNVTPLISPARVDSTASQQRSWLAIWNGDPPSPPNLPADNVTILLDDQLPGTAGNWMIRAFGTIVPIVEAPIDYRALTLFALLLTLAGAAIVRGRG